MKEQVLSIEQMRYLDELGVDTSKASCAYYAFYESEPNYYELRIRDSTLEIDSQTIPFMPTFTLQDMLEIMPKAILIDDVKYYLEIYPLTNWVVKYGSSDCRVPFRLIKEKLIDDVYECLCWLAENGYLKGGEK